jgi:hypothetical protein
MRFPLDRVAHWLGTRQDGAVPPPSLQDITDLVRRIDGWLLRARPLARSGCVTRGVTLFRFLRRAGADVSLRFGVGMVDGGVAAHCWIVYQGEPLAEPRDPRPIFTETWAIT